MKFRLLLLVFFLIYNAKSTESPYYIGADLGYGLINYDANFGNFAGIHKCGIYETGSGTGLKGRLFAEYRLLDFLNLGLHFGYETKDAEMNKLDTAFARNLNNGSVEIVETNNQLNMNFNAMEVGLDFNFLLTQDLLNGPLYLNLSPNLIFQTGGDYKQTEFLNSPNGAAFQEDGKIFYERLNAQGNFTTLEKTVFNLSVALLNSTKIAHNVYLTQKIALANDMGNLLTDADISTTSLYASLGVKLAFDEPKVIVPKIPPQKPEQPKPMPLRPIPTVVLKSEFDYQNSYIEKGEKLIATPPIVLAVFFDLNSSNLKPEYNSGGNTSNNPINEHYDILENLKEILDKNIGSKLKLNGSTSGADENNNLSLAKKRMETVRDRLIELGVQPDRLITSYSVNPEILTNVEYEKGLEENRRVSIGLVNANSIEFVKKTEYEQLYGKVNFDLEGKNIDQKLRFGSSILAQSESRDLGKFSKDFVENIVGKGDTLNIKSSAELNELVGATAELPVYLNKIKRRDISLKTDEFEAVLMFDFASSVLTKEAKSLLKQLADLLPEASTIQMIGNSDSIGLEKANKQIAEERAENAIQYIKSNSNKAFNFEKLTDRNEFEEDTPQGRYLNRSIIIRIK